MTNEETDPSPLAFLLSEEDLKRAVSANVLSQDAANRLSQWAHDERATLSTRTEVASNQTVEHGKGLNLVTVAYYFGAMLMISACAWFLGDKWDALGSKGILITSLIYAAITAAAGFWLRKQGYVIGGGLLITVAVSP
jgi:hypothetical protein